MSDTDLELLENYLDDELGSADSEALRKRLSSDPELSAAMDELRGQREMRQQFFASAEPDEASVQRLVQSVKRNINREVVWGERSRRLGMVGSLAACILVGFFVGRATRSGDNKTMPGTPVAVGLDQQPKIVIGSGPRITQSPEPQHIETVADKSDSPMRFDPPRNFGLTRIDPKLFMSRQFTGQVRLVDSSGNLIRQFDSPDQFIKYASEQSGATSQPSNNAFWQPGK